MEIIIGYHFSFDISMAVVLFFFLGDLLKLDDMKKNKLIKLALAILIWVILFYVTYPHLSDWTYLEVGLRRYSLYPLSFICALAATYGLCQVCDMVGERFLKPFIYLGKHSMILLCVHIMDQLWDFVWFYEKNQYITFLLRVASDLLVFVLISLIIGKMPKKNLKK